MTDNHNNVSLNAAFDRQLIWQRGDSVRYLVVDVATARVSIPERQQQLPLNLALVIDASGSMAGPPLTAACEAACRVVEGLSEIDRLSVVSFADDVQQHATSVAMAPDRKAVVQQNLRQLTTRGCTDLAGGWLAGAESVARDMEERSNCRNRVVLLSDGHANRGIQDPRELARIATDLRTRGVYSSTVGIGDNYSSDQILAIAEAGGGRMHDAARPEEIAEVVLAEIRDLTQTVANNVLIQLELPSGVEIDVLGTYPFEVGSGRATCAVGSLGSAATRRVAFKLQLPAGAVSQKLLFSTRATFRPQGAAVDVAISGPTVELKFVEGHRNSTQPRDIERSVAVAKLWQAHVVRTTVQLNRAGDYQAAEAYLSQELGFFTRYCEGLPEGAALVTQLEHTRRTAGQEWNERARKNMTVALYKASRCEVDDRVAEQALWFENLPE